MNTASPVVLASLMDGATAEQMKKLTDLRTQRVLTTVDEVWQLPLLSTLSTEQRQAITPLLAVDSQAFMALITATDSANMGEARQRFATVLISNTSTDNENVKTDTNNTNGDNTNNNAANNNANTNSDKANSTKQVKVITQRLWAFRPSF